MKINEILENYLNSVQIENQMHDFSNFENTLADHYEQVLDHRELLSQLHIIYQHRILSKALKKAKSNNSTFPYSKFIDFLIYADENQNSNEIHSLLSHFSIFDFTISDIQKLQNIPDFDDRYFQQRPHELIQMILENHQLKTKICELEQRIQNISILEEMSSNIKTLQDSIDTKITTQASHILNNIQTINNNVDKIQQIDSSLVEQIRDISIENQTNIIQHVAIMHHVKAFPRIPNKPYSGILKYCKSINSLKLRSGAASWKGELENILKPSGFYALFHSNETNHWIEFDFDSKVVKLLSYEIQTIDGSDGTDYYPISWKMLGSNDRNTWDDIDARKECNDFQESNCNAHFPCDLQSPKYYRYIRFLQTEGHPRSSKSLAVSRFELYGNVY